VEEVGEPSEGIVLTIAGRTEWRCGRWVAESVYEVFRGSNGSIL